MSRLSQHHLRSPITSVGEPGMGEMEGATTMTDEEAELVAPRLSVTVTIALHLPVR